MIMDERYVVLAIVMSLYSSVAFLFGYDQGRRSDYGK